jgi:MYXO-CTERM domain-containing protein
VPELGVKAGAAPAAPDPTTPQPTTPQPTPTQPASKTQSKGCGCATGDLGGPAGGALLAGLVMLALRRRRVR